MKHHHAPDAPLFQQPKPGKGFNFREMAATVNAKVAEQFPTNAAKAKAERDEAIRRVQEAAEVSWLAKAQEAIRACAAAELKTLGRDVLGAVFCVRGRVVERVGGVRR